MKMARYASYITETLDTLRYNFQSATGDDVKTLLENYRNLRPNKQPYYYNDGTVDELLSLEGTVPVKYKNESVYNIPLEITLQKSHPYSAPFVYVKPTQQMTINVGEHIDANGRISVPYMDDWKHPDSDLYNLVTVLTIIFEDRCPLYSKPPTAIPTTPPQIAATKLYKYHPPKIPVYKGANAPKDSLFPKYEALIQAPAPVHLERDLPHPSRLQEGPTRKQDVLVGKGQEDTDIEKEIADIVDEKLLKQLQQCCNFNLSQEKSKSQSSDVGQGNELRPAYRSLGEMRPADRPPNEIGPSEAFNNEVRPRTFGELKPCDRAFDELSPNERLFNEIRPGIDTFNDNHSPNELRRNKLGSGEPTD